MGDKFCEILGTHYIREILKVPIAGVMPRASFQSTGEIISSLLMQRRIHNACRPFHIAEIVYFIYENISVAHELGNVKGFYCE